jgi:hypothetical protein
MLLLVVFNRWQIFGIPPVRSPPDAYDFASERKVQSRRTLVSLCSPERSFFTLKFGESFVSGSRKMLAGRLF